MKTWTWLGSVALAMSLAGACGGGGSTPLTEDQFCTQKATKECQVTVRCGLASSDACITQRKAACLAFAASVKVAPRAFHPENAGRCLDRTNAAYAKTTITPTDMDGVTSACNYVFQGNVDKNGACTSDYDCLSAFICNKLFCATKVTKNKGDLCGNRGEVCAAGSYCAPDMTGQLTCLAKVAMGGLCSEAMPCLETLRCDATCMPKQMTGGACNSNDDCASTVPYCDPYSGNKCQVGLTFAAGVAACADYGGAAPIGTGGAAGGGTGGMTGGGTGGMTGGGTGGMTGSDAGSGTDALADSGATD